MSENEFLKLNYKLEEHDYLECLLFQYSRSKSNWLNSSPKKLFLSIVLFIAVMLPILYRNTSREIFYVFIPPVFIFVSFIFLNFFKKKIFLKIIRKRPKELLNQNIAITFLQEGIEILTNGITTKFEFLKITEIIQRNNYIFLLISEVSCIIIPTYKIDEALLNKIREKLLNLSNNLQIPIRN